MAQNARPTLSALTGARFFAAMWVVLFHYIEGFGFAPLLKIKPNTPAPIALMDTIIGQGFLAVDFFFVLSGFILAYNYIRDDGSLRGGKRAFWVARLARIYPVYVVAILLGLFQFLQSQHSVKTLVATPVEHLLLLQSWIPGGVVSDLNPPSWSLAAEALFYALFPTLTPFFARLSPRAQLIVAVVSCALYGVLLGALGLAAHVVGTQNDRWILDIGSFNPLVRLPEFLVGMSLGLFFMRSSRKEAESTRQASGVRRLAPDLIIGAILVALVAAIILAPAPLFQLSQVNLMGAVGLPLLAPIVYLLARQRGLIARALSLPLVLWLGEISYSMYILHWPVFHITQALTTQFLHISAPSRILFFGYPLVLITVAGLSFTFFEAPARRAIRRWWGGAESAPARLRQPAPTAASTR